MRQAVTMVVVQGMTDDSRLPGLPDGVSYRFAKGVDELRSALAGSSILFGFDYRARSLEAAWGAATDLRWIQWGGAGVDALLFPELVESDVVVTNAAGVFDRPIAEHVLGLMLAFAKDLPGSFAAQQNRAWNYRLTDKVAGTHAVIVGAGGIGREIARLLVAVGATVTVYATSSRSDAEFGTIHAWAPDHPALSQADWLILATPLTSGTERMIDGAVLDRLPTHARFINIGRGRSVDESALVDALRSGRLAGAGLDVFANEPLPPDSPLWGLEQVIVTPHHSGDTHTFYADIVDVFGDNLERFLSGRPLRNVIDKRKGYGAG